MKFPNFEIVDEYTARKVYANLHNAGVWYLYFPPTIPSPPRYPQFLEASYVSTPAMMNYLIQSK